jgi:hypothetical protein
VYNTHRKMSHFSLSDTLRSLASKLDSVQEVLNGTAAAGAAAGAWPPYPTLNSTVPVVAPISSPNTFVLQKLEMLSQELNQLKQTVAQINTRSNEASNASILPLNPIHGIEIIPKREVVVPQSLSVADRLLLNRDAKKALEAEEMGASRDDEYPLGEEDEEAEGDEDADADADGEEEAEEADEDADAEEAEKAPKDANVYKVQESVVGSNGMEVEPEEQAEEEEAEADAEEVELEEFEYKGSTYYRDPSNNNVFGQDEDGDVNTDQPIGLWDAEKNRIRVYR